LKHILTFSDLFESTSAYSHERAGWDFPPFKFAKSFDPRLGYSKDDFCKDVIEIYKESDDNKRSGLMDVIYKSSGALRISQIRELQNTQVNKLMKEVEEFLESQASEILKILPDGFVLCYENIMDEKGKRIDLYYSPIAKRIRVCYTGTYPEIEEYECTLEEFKPMKYKIGPEDFNDVIKKCNDERGELKNG
jgi:hypothetical protein